MTLWDKMFDWIQSYTKDEEEARGITNYVHYLAQKHSKASFVKGIVLGIVLVLILIKWLS